MKHKPSTPEERKENLSTNSSQSFELRVTHLFIKEARRLKKKYPNIKESFDELKKDLKDDPIKRSESSLGHDCYKVRMDIAGKPAGKSYGARVIINVRIIDKVVYLLSIYDKSDKTDLDIALEELLKQTRKNPFAK